MVAGHLLHLTVSHGEKEYVRDAVHINTAESFGALLECAKQGVFHYLSQNHLHRYLHEFEFRWEHRVPARTIKKKGNCLAFLLFIGPKNLNKCQRLKGA